MDEERETRFAVIDRMREAFADVAPEEIEREVAKALAEVHTEMTAERLSADSPHREDDNDFQCHPFPRPAHWERG